MLRFTLLLVCIPLTVMAQGPVLSANGVVNAASFVSTSSQGSGSVSPGAAISIFGTSLAPRLGQAPALPVPTTLDGVQVLVNDRPIPLFFVSPSQINAQRPWDVTIGVANVRVVTAGAASNSVGIVVLGDKPEIYTLANDGKGQAIIVHARDGVLAASPAVVPGARPAKAGDVLTLYANSLGPVSPPVEAGANSCAGSTCDASFSNLTLRRAVSCPRVSIDSTTIPIENVQFCGLAPQYVGLFQINFTVPAIPKSSGRQPPNPADEQVRVSLTGTLTGKKKTASPVNTWMAIAR